MSKRNVLLLGMLAAWSLTLIAQTIEIQADRSNAVYRCNEPVTFTIRVLDAEKQPVQSGFLNVALNNFGTIVITNLVADLAVANPVICTGSLAEPGFLRCDATTKIGKSVRGVWAVAVEPEKIRAGSERPADFDAFWDAAMRKIDAEVALDPRVEKMAEYTNEKHTCYRVSFATFDNHRVYGFLSLPAGKGPFPTRVSVPGAGPGVWTPNSGMADQGFAHLVMNVHTYEPASDRETQGERYKAQDEWLKALDGSKRYCLAGAATRETYFFYRTILGINRAVNWLADRPDIDLKHFTYSGSSQGGGFGYYLLGLNKHFTKGVVHVAALTDLYGFRARRMSGWPRLVESATPETREAVEKTGLYFDGAHFAPRITCPVRATVGFVDTTCPPCAVYSAFNAIQVKNKAMSHGLGMPHAVWPEFRKQLDNEWLRQR